MGRTRKQTTDVIDDVEDIEDNEEVKITNEDILEQIQKEIEKDFGKGIFVNGNDLVEREKIVIPVSPSINSILGGGIPEGSWVILAGKAKAGKTVTALHFAKYCQQPEYGSRNVYYLNVEGRIKKRDLLGIKGLNLDKFKIIESTENHILSSQDYLSMAEKILLTENRCVVIIDSISALCDERQLTGGIGTETRGGGAKLVAQFTSQMGNVVPVKNSIVIGILHLMANTSGYGASTFEKGGFAIQYQVDVKLRTDHFEPWKLTETSAPIGQKVTWKSFATGIIAPGRTCESYIRYGEGIDELRELVVTAKDVGLITGSKWLVCDFMQNHMDVLGITEWTEETPKELKLRANGEEKMRALLMERPELVECLKQDLSQW